MSKRFISDVMGVRLLDVTKTVKVLVEVVRATAVVVRPMELVKVWVLVTVDRRVPVDVVIELIVDVIVAYYRRKQMSQSRFHGIDLFCLRA